VLGWSVRAHPLKLINQRSLTGSAVP
jgi:hypothetical protein